MISWGMWDTRNFPLLEMQELCVGISFWEKAFGSFPSPYKGCVIYFFTSFESRWWLAKPFALVGSFCEHSVFTLSLQVTSHECVVASG